MTARKLRWTTLAAIVLCGATIAHAIERTKIPSFTVTDREGRSRSSESLQRSGAWLLLVVHPECTPCESLLRAAANLPPAASASRLVVLMSDGTSSDASSAIERFPELATAEWLIGASSDVIPALKLPSAAALFGVRGNMIEWSVSGVLTDPRDLQSIAASWLAGNTP